METPVYLMSPPRLDWTLKGKANFRSQSGIPVNADAAREEWIRLANAIVGAGGEVVVCPPNPKTNLTGMVYMAEAGEFFVDSDGRYRFILPNMAAQHRQSEADWIGGFMAGLGIEPVAIQSTWEAQGDVLRANDGEAIVHTFGSGKYARTEQTAYAEVSHWLSPIHIQIHFKANPWFHGNTFLGVYHERHKPERLGEAQRYRQQGVLVCTDALLPGELDRLEDFLPHARFVQISRDDSKNYDTNSLQVNDMVIASSTISQSARELFRSLDLELATIELSELFSKGGGAPVCLTNRLWGADVDHFPHRVRWSQRAALEHHTSF